MKNKIIFISLLLILTSCSTATPSIDNSSATYKSRINELEEDVNYLTKEINNLETEILELESDYPQELPADSVEVVAKPVDPFHVSKNTSYTGFCYYSGEDLPFLLPSVDSPRISNESLWLPPLDNFIVEIIRHYTNGWYLVRIPLNESFAYVQPDDLNQITINDYPIIELSSFSINQTKVGDDVNKLIASYKGSTFLSGNYGDGIYYDLYPDEANPFSSQGIIYVDTFNRITGLHISTDQFVLDSDFRVGDYATKVIEYYDDQFERFYTSDSSDEIQLIKYKTSDTYILGFVLDGDYMLDDTKIISITVSTDNDSEY